MCKLLIRKCSCYPSRLSWSCILCFRSSISAAWSRIHFINDLFGLLAYILLTCSNITKKKSIISEISIDSHFYLWKLIWDFFCPGQNEFISLILYYSRKQSHPKCRSVRRGRKSKENRSLRSKDRNNTPMRTVLVSKSLNSSSTMITSPSSQR